MHACTDNLTEADTLNMKGSHSHNVVGIQVLAVRVSDSGGESGGWRLDTMDENEFFYANLNQSFITMEGESVGRIYWIRLIGPGCTRQEVLVEVIVRTIVISLPLQQSSESNWVVTAAASHCQGQWEHDGKF